MALLLVGDPTLRLLLPGGRLEILDEALTRAEATEPVPPLTMGGGSVLGGRAASVSEPLSQGRVPPFKKYDLHFGLSERIWITITTGTITDRINASGELFGDR